MKDNNINKIKANPHINVINSNLWTVNFEYVLNGWIDDLKFYNADSNSFVTIANDIIILNSNKEMCSRVIPILEYIMKLSDKRVGTKESFCDWLRKDMKLFKTNKNDVIIKWIEKNGYNQVEKLYLQLCKLEIQRRNNKRKEVKRNGRY